MAEQLLEAATIGSDVPPGPFPVEIHSVFRSAVNLQPRDGGDLITLLSLSNADHPRGLRLDIEDFTRLGLEPKSAGRFHGNGLSLNRREGLTPLHISFSTAKRLEAKPLPSIPHLGESWKASAELLEQLQSQANTDFRLRALVDPGVHQEILGTRLTQAAQELGTSVKTGALTTARHAISRLVGLGSGLTPSGDDFLGGFLTAAHCRLEAHPDHLPFLRELKRFVLEQLSNTNAISATFLRCATEGKVSRALLDFAEALRGGMDSRPAMARLCTFGHSSGMDITTGFLFGLTVWE